MVGHDHPRMHFVISQLRAVLDGVADEFSYWRLPQERRAGCALIEQPVHCQERFARGEIRSWKRAMPGKAVAQAECDE